MIFMTEEKLIMLWMMKEKGNQSKAERNWTNREFKALVKRCNKWQCYISHPPKHLVANVESSAPAQSSSQPRCLKN